VSKLGRQIISHALGHVKMIYTTDDNCHCQSRLTVMYSRKKNNTQSLRQRQLWWLDISKHTCFCTTCGWPIIPSRVT